jgi:hypothetical protein
MQDNSPSLQEMKDNFWRETINISRQELHWVLSNFYRRWSGVGGQNFWNFSFMNFLLTISMTAAVLRDTIKKHCLLNSVINLYYLTRQLNSNLTTQTFTCMYGSYRSTTKITVTFIRDWISKFTERIKCKCTNIHMLKLKLHLNTLKLAFTTLPVVSKHTWTYCVGMLGYIHDRQRASYLAITFLPVIFLLAHLTVTCHSQTAASSTSFN